MRQFVFAFLLGYVCVISANPCCPESLPPLAGYVTVGSGWNISVRPIGKYYSQSLAELAKFVEITTEAGNPGWDLVLNSPTDGSRAPICFTLYINGKIWPEYDTINAQQRCGSAFATTGINFNYGPANLICPLGYTLQKGRCVNQNPKSTLCPFEEKSFGEQECCVGNPIYPPTGNKFEKEVDYESPGPYPLAWIRYYNSAWPDVTRLGQQWRHTFDRRVLLLPLTRKGALLERPDGKRILFKEVTTGLYESEDASLGALSRLNTDGFQFYDRPLCT